MNVAEIKSLLARYGINPLKSRGQHFLINEQAIRKVIHIAHPTQYVTIIEVGPGLGVLTRELASPGGPLIAVEIDKGFCKVLQDSVGKLPNVTIINQDILTTPLPLMNDYTMVSNLPYNIAPHILEKFLSSRDSRPSDIVVTVQKEFAQRICATPGNMNRIGLLVQYHGVPSIIEDFPPHYFWPQPAVHSSLVCIRVRSAAKLPLSLAQEHSLWELTRKAFGQPRKKISSFVGKHLGATGNKRPQEVSLAEWISIASLL